MGDNQSIGREPRGNQKLKIMYLMKVLMEETDEAHDITLAEIIESHIFFKKNDSIFRISAKEKLT